MTVRSILTWPDPLLKVKSEFIEVIDESVINLAQDLVDTMNVSFGAGLAATQIGDLRSVVAIRLGYAGLDLPEDPIIKGAVILVNPEIEAVGEEKFTWEEACLSIPGYQGAVRRNKRISLSYSDLLGGAHQRELESEPSGVVQHETDHLIGKLFVDRMPSRTRRLVLMGLRRKIQDSRKSRAKFLKMISREEAAAGEESRSVIGRPRRKKKLKKQFGKNKKRK